ncbi:hypothetical protein [Thermus tengchongensis]|uniref:hypothetical protein n=1 Tax=Thermus tengchongensis TaxID=1214928 RepID=UPI002E812028|nr:hypothetical protein [Thermus tengchongensis]
MRDHGGFEHNARPCASLPSWRALPGFKGLNLTYEVREGIATHEAAYAPGFKPEYPGRGTSRPRWWTSRTPSLRGPRPGRRLRSGLLSLRSFRSDLSAGPGPGRGFDLLRFSRALPRDPGAPGAGLLITAAIEPPTSGWKPPGVESAEGVRQHPSAWRP